jgi:hypothetical protein
MSTQPSSTRPSPREARGPVVFGSAYREAMSELDRRHKGKRGYDRRRLALLRRYMNAAPDARETVAWEYVIEKQREVRR